MAEPAVPALCLDWHVKHSDAFIDMLVDPLAPHAKIKLQAWDGAKYPAKILDEPLVIFCMLPPTEEFLKAYKGKVVWLPMWDQAQGYDQDWWNNLSPSVNVIAFSDVIEDKARKAGLPMLKLKYYKNPADFTPVGWRDGYRIFYWNRTGLVGPEFLKDLCSSTGANELIFLGDIDPRVPAEKRYSLPAEIGDTKVTKLKLAGRDKFLAAVDRSNVFIAPRASEGVGMTFLEAMARGAAVIAYDAPTMNEYIQDGRDGILLRNRPLSLADKLLGRRPTDPPSGEIYYLKSSQNWDRLARVNFQALGDRARQKHIQGYDDWSKQIADYAKFVLGDV